jgi:folate-dependent phosphoribosylglycinamide formyltransferase PurN
MMTDQELAEELKGESLYGRRRALSNHGNATVNEVCERGGGREAPIESLFVESAPNYHFDEHLTEELTTRRIGKTLLLASFCKVLSSDFCDTFLRSSAHLVE